MRHIIRRFCRTRGRWMGKCEKERLLRGGRAWGVRDCAGETGGSGRTKPYRGIRCVEGCPSVLRKAKVLIFIEEKGFVRDGKVCGERCVSFFVPAKAACFSDCRPFYWNCTPRPEAKTPHPSRCRSTPSRLNCPLRGRSGYRPLSEEGLQM